MAKRRKIVVAVELDMPASTEAKDFAQHIRFKKTIKCTGYQVIKDEPYVLPAKRIESVRSLNEYRRIFDQVVASPEFLNSLGDKSYANYAYSIKARTLGWYPNPKKPWFWIYVKQLNNYHRKWPAISCEKSAISLHERSTLGYQTTNCEYVFNIAVPDFIPEFAKVLAKAVTAAIEA